ncbi:MAG: ribonuclease Z [Thermoplasmatota archaeon]
MTQLQLIFLGTGGSWPTVKRNVTSLAVKRDGEILLFDCGEGTQRQFQKSQLSYMQITHLFITHFHGDHFLGIPGLIQTMQLNDRRTPLHIYGPKGMIPLLNQLLQLGYFKPTYDIIAYELTPGEHIDLDGYAIETLATDHGIPSLAYALIEAKRPGRFNKPKALSLGIPEGPLFSKLQKGTAVTLEDGTLVTPSMVLGPSRRGRKIVFSGDTRPTKNMISFAQDADVLIHEATFASDLEENALNYGHSTAAQAAEIAKKAKVKALYLTHISPRYLDYRDIQDDAREIFAESYVPKDFDQVTISLEK